jgi:MFS family permease
MALMFAALGPILPMLASHFGGASGAFAAQMIMTVPALGVIGGGLAAGYLVSRFKPRPVMLTALLAYGLAGASGYFSNSLPVLLLTRFVVGFSAAHVGTAAAVIIGAWYAGTARLRLLGYQAAVAGGFAVGCLLLSGALAEALGWRSPFLLYLLSLPLALLALLILPPDAGTEAPQTNGEPRQSLAILWRLWPVYLLAMGLFVGYFMTSIQLSLLLAADGVTSAVTRSLVIAGGVCAGALFGGSYGRAHAALGLRAVQFLLVGLLGTGLLLIGTATSLGGMSLPVTALGAILAGGGGGMIPPHISGILLDRVPHDLRARAVGFEYTVLYAADFLNPVIITPIRGLIGAHGAFAVVGLILLMVAILGRPPRATLTLTSQSL